MKSILMLLCGGFCVFGGILHSVGGLTVLPDMLAKTNVPAELAKELGIVWLFMGAAMVTFGLILLTCGLRMRNKDYSGSVLAMWVAVFLILYDTGAMIWYGKLEPHFSAFIVTGALAVFAALPPKNLSKAE